MAIPSRQIGWGTTDNLLWEISKQIEGIGCIVACGTSGGSGTSGTSGVSGTSGISGSSGTSGVSPSLPVSLNYGLFSQTGDSFPVSGTIVETTLINGGVGTLTVPANGFTVGDSFRVLMGGVIDAGNNETIRIKVKAGSTILLDSGIQTLTSAVTNDIWSLNVDFTIRQIGAAGVASIASLGRFTYLKTNNGAFEGFGFNTVNSSSFNTTISNTLDITATWGSTDPENSIYSDVFILNKTY